MATEFEKYNKEAHLIDAFELISKYGKEDDIERILPTLDDDGKERLDLDWERLKRIATKRSLFERIWDSSLRFGNKELAIYVTLSVILSPLILILTYNWASLKLPTVDLLLNIKIIALLVFVISMVVLILSSIVYILFERFPISRWRVEVPALEKRHTLSSVIVSACMVALIGGFYNFASLSEPKMARDYIYVNLDGRDKVIDNNYKALFSNQVKANELTEKYTEILGSLKKSGSTDAYFSENPEFYNAMAVYFEKEGELIKAQEAYLLAEERDPFVMVKSYKLNNSPRKGSLEEWEVGLKQGDFSIIRLGEKGNRVVSAKDVDIFSDKEAVKSFLKLNHNCDSTGNTFSCYNTKAVALEFLQKDEEAKEVYSKLLKNERYNPTVLYNLKEIINLDKEN